MARGPRGMYHSHRDFGVSIVKDSETAATLHLLSDRVIESPELDDVVHILTHDLPHALGLPHASFVLWNRNLDSFEGLSPGETKLQTFQAGSEATPAPKARYLLSDGTLLDLTHGVGDAVMVPLLARSGLIGMLTLAPLPGQRRRPLSVSLARQVSKLADRAALAVENALYHREIRATERLSALGSMAEMLAHDFRGPMTIIRGYAESMLMPDPTPEDIHANAELIIEMVDRLERMTRETLDFARAGGRLNQRPTRLGAFLEHVAEEMSASLPGLTVVRDLDIPDRIVLLDESKLSRALDNLAANARDAMKGSGRLHLKARVEEPGDDSAPPRAARLILLVEDEGPGIAPEIRSRLFEPFVTHGKKRGTGLGLTVARHFIEDHEGTIELLPSEAGRPSGARFLIVIPLATTPQPPQEDAP
jgi:signal transduction histidine kinase